MVHILSTTHCLYPLRGIMEKHILWIFLKKKKSACQKVGKKKETKLLHFPMRQLILLSNNTLCLCDVVNQGDPYSSMRKGSLISKNQSFLMFTILYNSQVRLHRCNNEILHITSDTLETLSFKPLTWWTPSNKTLHKDGIKTKSRYNNLKNWKLHVYK